MGDLISRQSLKQKLQEHHDFFVDAYGGFSNLPQNDKSRVDEITNCIAMVVNEPSVTIPSVENQCFDGMTNGEVIQALFPNMTIAHKSSNGVLIVVENLDSPYPHEFYTEWWNAPYKKGGE